MPKRPFKLDRESVVLPKGTRIILRQSVRDEQGSIHRAGSFATVKEICRHTYTVETPSGRSLQLQRDQITAQREDLLESLGRREWDFRLLRDEVIYSAVMGSRAWGLADEDSDADIRGCFVAPFEVISSLWDAPMDLQDPAGNEAYWEVEKFIVQGLKGDANTLETLWSPLPVLATPLGEHLVERRRMFVSMNLLGSFGRYAQSQFRLIARTLRHNEVVVELLDGVEKGRITNDDQAMDLLVKRGLARSPIKAKQELVAIGRSLCDRGLTANSEFRSLVAAVADGRGNELRPPQVRPKNAYNLLRLLHSCLSWMRTGEPLIVVTGDLRDVLLRIKKQEIPIEDTVRMAKELTLELDEVSHSATLPAQPDFEAADDFLRLCRREAARKRLASASTEPGGGSSGTVRQELIHREAYVPDVLPTELPADIDPSALRRFLAQYVEPQSGSRSDTRTAILWLALSGAHAYGFPSPDSDLDLKGVFTAPASAFVGLNRSPEAIDFLGEWEGREYDLTLNELGQAAKLVLQGNGNMIERFLGPFPLVTTPAGKAFRELVRRSLSRKAMHHYAGFFTGMQREHEAEARSGRRSAKTLLYAYRVALTGIHLMRTGEVVTDVRPLSREYGYADHVDPLMARKQTAEGILLGESECAPFVADWVQLDADIAAALEASQLPEEPPNSGDFERFLIEQRLLRDDSATA